MPGAFKTVSRSGVTDPKKVTICGASYGGYAALVGATFTPDVFACAVDGVGMSDWARAMKAAPPHWELVQDWSQ
jgi:dipeptidyl aminopeptidase/acylaminoacyl peptidase